MQTVYTVYMDVEMTVDAQHIVNITNNYIRGTRFLLGDI